MSIDRLLLGVSNTLHHLSKRTHDRVAYCSLSRLVHEFYRSCVI